MKSLCFVLGTRPEIIKLAPLIRRAKERGLPIGILHSNQHFDPAMDRVFFEELTLPVPDHHLHVGSKSASEMIAAILIGCEKAWSAKRPSVVIVQGDTNTMLAGGLAASKCELPVAHVEAGLRSDDFSMPEEINRILADHLASRLYAPTKHQVDRLEQEGIAAEKILLTGNTILDAVTEHTRLAKDAVLPPALAKLPERYALLTLHRPSLVDDPVFLETVLSRLDAALRATDLTGVFLVHPRTQRTLSSIRGKHPALMLHAPIGYLPMLRLLSRATCVITDSGGLQEEAAILRVRCLTLRTTTERPETIDAGGNVIVPPTSDQLTSELASLLKRSISWKPLYPCDHPSDAILSDLVTRYL